MKKIAIVIAILGFAQPLFAVVMSSTNYSIQADSANFGGGLSNSTNYTQESTFGGIATGPSGSTNYNIKAGYQQMNVVYIAIATVANVTLSPSIDGTVGGTANGSTTVTVTTDSSAGYQLYIKASSSPALVSGANSFADYTPAGANPDFTFSIAASASEFAFSPEGSHITSEYKDNGTSCNTGVLDTNDSCWSPLTTTNELIASSASGNHPAGTATVVEFRASSGASNTQVAGAYTATTTVTATAL